MKRLSPCQRMSQTASPCPQNLGAFSREIVAPGIFAAVSIGKRHGAELFICINDCHTGR